MAVTFRASSVASQTGGSNTTITITKPAGTVNGDLMIAHFQLSGAQVVDLLSGWTLVSSNANPGSFIYKKVASSEGADYTWSISGVAGNFRCGGAITSIYDSTGVALSTAIFTQTVDASADTTVDNTGVTPTLSPGAMLMVFMGGNGTPTHSNYAVANNNPSWTEAYDSPSSFGGEGSGFAMAYAVRDLITATGAFTATASVSSESTSYMFSIQPVGLTFTAGFSLAGSILASVVAIVSSITSSLFTLVATPQVPTVAQADSDWTTSSKNTTVWVNSQQS